MTRKYKYIEMFQSSGKIKLLEPPRRETLVSDNTRNTPKPSTTADEARHLIREEIAGRKVAIKNSNEATGLSGFGFSAAEHKMRLFPNEVDNIVDEHLNPGVSIGRLADNLGKGMTSGSITKLLTAVGEPLIYGALSNIGIPKKWTGSVKNNINNKTGNIKRNLIRDHDPVYNKGVKEGEKWISRWYSDPTILKRIKNNNKSRAIDIDIPEYVDDLTISKFDNRTLKRNTTDWRGIFFHDNKRAYVKPQLTSKQNTASTTIHELTHKLTQGDYGLSMKNKNLTKRLFSRSEGNIDYVTHNYPEPLRTDLRYLFKPTEAHARINELRYLYKLKPNNIVDENLAKRIIDDVAENKTKIDYRFGKYIKSSGQDYLKRVTDAFNKLPIATTVGTTATLLNKQNEED